MTAWEAGARAQGSTLTSGAGRAIGPVVRRLLALLTMIAFAVSLAAGTGARASQPIPCATAEQASAGELHYEGDADEVAADEDGASPHHHGVGHDHGVGLAHSIRAVGSAAASGPRLVPGLENGTLGAGADPALRPPTA